MGSRAFPRDNAATLPLTNTTQTADLSLHRTST
jgi:hypothetical protein